MTLRVRYKDQLELEATVASINFHGVGEVILQYDDGSASSEELKLLEPIPPMTRDEMREELRKMEP